MTTTTLIYNHDAAIDEYMAALLLDTMSGFRLHSLVISNADCIPDAAMATAWQINQFTQRDVPLSLSGARVYNAFPYSYRVDCIREGAIDCLKPFGPAPAPPYPDGDEALASALRSALGSGEKVTLVCTTSLTTLRDVLIEEPDLEGAIEHVLWMGGAVYVPGNLDPTTIPPSIANPAAEWNVFSDPTSADWVLNHPGRSYRMTVCPLDCTDKAKITPEFKQALARQAAAGSKLSTLASQSYALVADEPFYELWNVCTVVYLTHPELYSAPVKTALSIQQIGFYQGNMKPSATGVPVDLVLDLVRPSDFYEYVLRLFDSY